MIQTADKQAEPQGEYLRTVTRPSIIQAGSAFEESAEVTAFLKYLDAQEGFKSFRT